MKVLSLFSGIGAFENALTNLGIKYETVGFSEIDKYAVKSYCAIHNQNEELNLGDITKIDLENLPKCDLITHGSPCQDFSVAGNQAGGDKGTDTRSSLMWNSVEIIRRCRPKFVIWENVKNVLSKKHRHNFDKYIQSLEEIGYRSYYQVLNAKNYGIPQNRERIFCISIRKDKDKGFDFPKTFDNGIRLKDLLEDEVDEKFYISDEKASKLISQLKDKDSLLLDMCQSKREGKPREYTEVSPTLSSRDYKEPRLINVGNVNPSGKSMNGNVYAGSMAPTLIINKGEGSKICVPCLTPDRIEKRQNGRRFKEDGEPMFTLTSQDRHGVLQVGNIVDTGNWDNPQRGRVYSAEGCSPSLNTVGGGGLEPKIVKPIPLDEQNMYLRKDGNIGSLTTDGSSPKHNNRVFYPHTFRIRKLTPKECFRLMGFTDVDFETAKKALNDSFYKGKDRSNSQLYKQAGNSIVVNVLEEIFKKLQEIYDLTATN